MIIKINNLSPTFRVIFISIKLDNQILVDSTKFLMHKRVEQQNEQSFYTSNLLRKNTM